MVPHSVEVRGQLWKLVLSFHHAGSRDQTRVVGLSGRRLYTLRHLTAHALFSFRRYPDALSRLTLNSWT